MTKIKLLSALGLHEHAPVISIIAVISLLMGIGMTADWIAGDDRQWIGFFLVGVPFASYMWINYRSRNLSFEAIKVEGDKKYLIAIIPSNIGLLEIITKPHPNLEKIYFMYDNFSNEKIVEVKNLIKQDKRCIQDSFLYLESLQNPKNMIASFESILEHLKNFDAKNDEILIEVTTGQTLSSLTLYELGKLKKIDVSCSISQYNAQNSPIQNSAVPYKIEFDF